MYLLCASAGGCHVVVWDMGEAGSPRPVRQNGRASLLLGHHSVINWLGFQPTLHSSKGEASEASEEEGGACIGSASADGRIMVHHVDRTPRGGGEGDATPQPPQQPPQPPPGGAGGAGDAAPMPPQLDSPVALL